MELISDAGKKVKVGNNGDSFVLAKLSPNDRAAIMEAVKQQKRVKLLDNLKSAGISGQEYFNEVDAFDQDEWGDSHWVGTAQTNGILDGFNGRALIIDAAGKKEHGDKWKAIKDDLVLDFNDEFKLAAMLSGVRLVSKSNDSAPQEASEPRPSEAAV